MLITGLILGRPHADNQGTGSTCLEETVSQHEAPPLAEQQLAADAFEGRED